jgi:hypothetical protein
MKHTEAQYITLGYRYEKAKSPEAGQAAAQAIRSLIEDEAIDDRADARYLIERGRQEARGVTA